MSLTEANKLRILYFLVFCCTASWLPVMADFLKDRGLSGIQTGAVLAVIPLMMFLVQPFYGSLTDRLGYKRCLLLSSVFASLSYLMYLLDGGFLYLVIVTVFMSLFYNSIQPILDSLALKLSQDDARFSYGKLRIAGAAGWAFTGIITGQLIDHINTSVIFAVSAISMMLAFLFAFTIKNDRRTVSQEQSFNNIRDAFKSRTLIFLLFCVFLISAGASTIWYFYSIYMKENGASASLVGYGLSFQGLCELPLFYFSARIIARLGMKWTLLLTVFATVIRLALYGIIKNPYAAIPIELLHGFSWSLFWVVCVEYVNILVDEKSRVTGQSLLYAAYYGAGTIAGNLWTGYLSDTDMRVSEIFMLNAGILTVVGIFLFLFMKMKKS